MIAPRTDTRSSHASRVALLAILALLAGALLLGSLPARARAETPVSLNPAEVSTALFVAGDVARLSKVPSGSEELVLEKALQQLYADEAALAPATAEGYVDEMKALLAAPSAPSQASLQLMAGNQRILAILAALERPYGSPASELPAAAKLAVTQLAAVALSGSADIFADAETPKYFEPQADARTNLTYTTFAPAGVLRATRELAVKSRPFGEARDALWAKASEESVFSGWAELLGESKNILDSAALQGLRAKIEAGHGTISEEPAQLAELFTAGQKTTQEQACEHAGAGEEEIGGKSIDGIPALKCSGGALYEAAKVPGSCPEKAKCEAELEHLQTQAEKQARAIAEERAVMTAAAELLRPSDNTAAALEQATAQAQAQISEEETAYATYEAEQATRELIIGTFKSAALGASAGLALGTGEYAEGITGLIGVAFELYEHAEGALRKPPPGPQEIALKDLSDLSTQLAGFQQYTQEAFHAINTQLAQLTSQLAQENYELKEELGALGEKLEKEQGTIFALQDQVKELFAAQTQAGLQTTIEDSVGWLARTGEPLSGPRTQEALIALKKDATEIADGPLVNSQTQPYTYEGAGRQLTSQTTGEPAELSEDITYLARFPREQGWVTTAAPASLPNTTFWSESARAYAQLLLENESDATAPDIAGLKALEKEGTTLEQAAAVWSEPSAGAKTGNAILDQALEHFEAQVNGAGVDGTSSIETLLNEAAEKYLEKENNLTPGSKDNPTEFKLWGGANQSFSVAKVAAAKYPAFKWKECSGSDGTNPEQEMPEEFIKSLPAVLVNGVRLGVIGTPGSGALLTLSACRFIFKGGPEGTGIKTSDGRTECGEPEPVPDCEAVYRYETKSDQETEFVTEDLTLGDSGATPVGDCVQTSLFWTGAELFYYEDTIFEDYDSEPEAETYSGFTERHTGSVFELYPEAYPQGYDLRWDSNPYPFADTACPHSPEAATDEAGLEFAKYGENEGSPPLGSVEPTLVKDDNAKLRELQEGAYDEGLTTLKNPPGGEDPAASLAGTRALVQSYVKLGFPQAVASDPVLEGDIEGVGAQFLDPEPGTAGTPRPLPEQLTSLVGSWIARVKNADEPELEQLVKKNLTTEVAERSSKWAGELAEQLKPYVEGKVPGFTPDATEAVGESSPLVESTLDRLQLSGDVLTELKAPSGETPPPSSNNSNSSNSSTLPTVGVTPPATTIAPPTTTIVSPPKGAAAVAPKECVSHRKVTVHVADDVKAPPRTTLKSSRILVAGRVVAKLKGRTEVAVVRFAAAHKGPYKVTIVAKFSHGKTRKVTIVFHPCTTTHKPATRKR